MVKHLRPKYAIRSLAPSNGYMGVWTHEVDGRCEIETSPLDFIGVADVRVCRNGKWIDDGPEIVAIKLTDGFFDLITEGENFHGIVRTGTTWDECLYLLPTDLQSRTAVPEGHVAVGTVAASEEEENV